MNSRAKHRLAIAGWPHDDTSDRTAFIASALLARGCSSDYLSCPKYRVMDLGGRVFLRLVAGAVVVRVDLPESEEVDWEVDGKEDGENHEDQEEEDDIDDDEHEEDVLSSVDWANVLAVVNDKVIYCPGRTGVYKYEVPPKSGAAMEVDLALAPDFPGCLAPLLGNLTVSWQRPRLGAAISFDHTLLWWLLSAPGYTTQSHVGRASTYAIEATHLAILQGERAGERAGEGEGQGRGWTIGPEEQAWAVLTVVAKLVGARACMRTPYGTLHTARGEGPLCEGTATVLEELLERLGSDTAPARKDVLWVLAFAGNNAYTVAVDILRRRDAQGAKNLEGFTNHARWPVGAPDHFVESPVAALMIPDDVCRGIRATESVADRLVRRAYEKHARQSLSSDIATEIELLR